MIVWEGLFSSSSGLRKIKNKIKIGESQTLSKHESISSFLLLLKDNRNENLFLIFVPLNSILLYYVCYIFLLPSYIQVLQILNPGGNNELS